MCVCVCVCVCVCITFFWHEGYFWFGCLLSLSSVCTDCYPLDRGCSSVLHECASREMGQWAGPVASAWLLGPWQWWCPSGMWRLHPETLAATTARCGCPHGSEGKVWCSVARPSSVVTHILRTFSCRSCAHLRSPKWL